MSDSQAPKSKIMQYRDLVLAITGLVVGVGSFIKPPDTTATEKSYDVTATQINALAEDQRALQQDVANLRGFLDGYLAADDDYSDEDDEDEVEPTPQPSRRRRAAEAPREPEPEPKRPTLPKMTSQARSYKKVDFDQIMQMPMDQLPIVEEEPHPVHPDIDLEDPHQ